MTTDETALRRLATIRIVFFSLTSLWTCWITATAGLDITMLKWGDWLQTVVGCLASWGLTMMAFVDRSVAQISAGKIPGLEDGQKPETKT